MLTAAADAIDFDAGTPALAAALVRFALDYLRAHRALGAVRDHDVDQLLRLVVPHAGADLTVIDLVARTVAPVLAVEPHAGRLRCQPLQAAELLVRTVLSVYLSPSDALSDDEIATAAAASVCR